MGRVADMVDRWMALKGEFVPIYETLPTTALIRTVNTTINMDIKNEINLLRQIAKVKDATHYKISDGLSIELVKQFKGFYIRISIIDISTVMIELEQGSHEKNEIQTKQLMSYDEYFGEYRKVEHELNEIVRSNGPCVFVKPSISKESADI